MWLCIFSTMSSNWCWTLMQLPIMSNWKLSWGKVSPFKWDFITNRKASTLFWASAVSVPRRKNFSSLAFWTQRTLCSIVSWCLSRWQTLFFKTELALHKLKVEKTLQAAFLCRFPKTWSATPEDALTAGKNRLCWWWVVRKKEVPFGVAQKKKQHVKV